jgi:hypothetical protein
MIKIGEKLVCSIQFLSLSIYVALLYVQYSKAKLKSNDDKTSIRFRSFLIGNESGKYLSGL